MKKIIFLIIILFELILILTLWQKYINNETLKNSYAIENETELPIYYLTDFNLTIPSKNPNLSYELRPNFSADFDGYQVRLSRVTHIKINSDGLRDREFSIQKPNNTFRIIALGDSYTFGWGVELNETYPKVLERELNSLNNGINYEVLNFGVPGYDFEQKLESLKEKGLKYNPDMIIIQYNMDDIIFHNDFQELEDKLEVEKYKELLNVSYPSNAEEALQWKKLDNETIVLLTNQMKNANSSEIKRMLEPYCKEFYDLTKNYNIKVLLLTFWTENNHLESLKEISKEYGWKLIDLDDLFSEYPWYDLVIDKNDVHPNPFANRLIGEEIYYYLKQDKIVLSS